MLGNNTKILVCQFVFASSLLAQGMKAPDAKPSTKRRLLLTPPQPSPVTSLAPLSEDNSIFGSNGHEDDWFWNLEIFADFLGPIHYQTFARSEISGELKYDPVLYTYGISPFFLFPTAGFDHGPRLLIRTAPSYQNTVNSRREGESEPHVQKVSISSAGFGLGYLVQKKLRKGEFWCPSLEVRTERNDVQLNIETPEAVSAEDRNLRLHSSLIFGAVIVGNRWYLDQAFLPWGFGFSVTLPLFKKTIDDADSQTKIELADKLEHRSKFGFGLSGVLGIWF